LPTDPSLENSLLPSETFGATLGIFNKKNLPLELYTGIYNGEGLYNQEEWKTSFSFVFRSVIHPTENIHLSFNYNSIQPEDKRMNLYDIGGYIDANNWHFETEFFIKPMLTIFSHRQKDFLSFPIMIFTLQIKKLLKLFALFSDTIS
jgi:hypothetical protein